MVLWAGQGDRTEVYGLLATLVLAEYGLTALPELARKAGGKPWFPARPGLHFNVSHSGGLLLCGAGAAPLGVDIERVRPRRAGLARFVLSGAEYDWYQAQGGGWEALCALWTLKEARCKYTGEGLSRPPREIAVPLLDPGETGRLDGLTFRAYGGPDWRAAACGAEERPPEVIHWR